MALTRSLNRVELPVHTVGDPIDRGSLVALSQRKLNALGVPVAYVDRNQRYRFCNKAFLDWLGKTDHEVLGREAIEVLGRDVYLLYRAYIDAALAGERTTYERQLILPARPAIWIRVDYFAQASDERLDKGILDRLARRDVVPVDLVIVGPLQDGVRGQLGAVVAHDRLGLAAFSEQADRVRGATRMPEIEVSATSARHSRVQSSTTTRMRKRRPSMN